jgi:hypothetical protein
MGILFALLPLPIFASLSAAPPESPTCLCAPAVRPHDGARAPRSVMLGRICASNAASGPRSSSCADHHAEPMPRGRA